MRVLVWSEGFWPYIGGIQVASRHLLPALRRRGCEIAVITAHRNLDLPDEERYEGIRVHRFPFYRALERCDLDELAAVLRAVARLKRTFRPDLVHVNSIGQCLLFHLRTARAHRAPELLTLHVEPPAGSLRRETVVGAALRSADWVTACSEAVLREARRQAPEIEPRSSVIHYGLPAPTLDPSPLPFDPPRLLCLGRLVPRKGLDLAIRALALLARRMPAARLVVAGAGPLRTALQELAAELDVGDRVEFLGSIPPGQVLALINTATLLVLPSRYEGMPLVAIEAAQMGRPTVATRVSGLPELILDGVGRLAGRPGRRGRARRRGRRPARTARASAPHGRGGATARPGSVRPGPIRRRVPRQIRGARRAADAPGRELEAGVIAADTRVRHARPLLWDALRTILPTPSQTQLLRACLLPGEPGRQAWKAWLRLSGPPRPRGRHDLTWPPRLLPLIDDAAERHGVELDPAVRTLLRAARYREALRSATYFRICREVLLVLDSARVPVVVLKGAALAATAYPHVALRHSHDIDLLVREADLRRAAGALAAAGFAESRRLLGGGAGDPRLVHESGLPVELHPRPFQTPCARGQSAEIWSRTVERRVADRPALVLSPADSLLQVCSQAAIAGGRGSLGWACDAWLLTARSPNLAWDLLAATAARAHLALPLYTLLRYLREELGAPIPDEVLRVLAGSAAGDPLGREIALAGARRGGRGAYPELLRRCESWREQRLILNWLVRPSPAFIRWDCPVPAARPLPLFQLYRAARHVGRRLRRARG